MGEPSAGALEQAREHAKSWWISSGGFWPVPPSLARDFDGLATALALALDAYAAGVDKQLREQCSWNADQRAEITALRARLALVEGVVGKKDVALRKFLDYYPCGTNPDCDDAYSMARAALALTPDAMGERRAKESDA